MSQRILVTLLVAFIASFVGLSGFAGEVVRAGKAPPSIRSEAGLVRYGSGIRELSNLRRYGVLIVGPASAKRAAAQPGRSLLYGCGVSIPNATWSASCGVSWGEAVANNWLLKDANGKYVPYGPGYSNEYLADIGNSSYQKKFISAMDSEMRSVRGLDGVFIDSVAGNLINVSDKYRDNASYRLAMLSFIKTVGRGLRAKGWYVAVNAGMNDDGAQGFAGDASNGAQYVWWYKQIAPYVDAMSTERWQQYWGESGAPVRTSGPRWNQAWDEWERLPSIVAALGKDFYAIESGAVTDTAKAAYLRASFLLVWKRSRGFFFFHTEEGDPWPRIATPDVGRPTGPSRRVGVGFARTFSRGVAAVNPSPSQFQTFDFQRKYLMPDGTTRRSITLSPASGAVLRRASTAQQH